MYEYRKLTDKQKAEVRRDRYRDGRPFHAPPHSENVDGWYLITAATFEHVRHFRIGAERQELLDQLFSELDKTSVECNGWVILPNHYHLLLRCSDLSILEEPIRKVHGRTARAVNRRDGIEGRKVWYRYSDRRIRDSRHYYATLNYIHFNPVKHRYVKKPLEWECSSVHGYLEQFGVEWLRASWVEYPVDDYGRGWDW